MSIASRFNLLVLCLWSFSAQAADNNPVLALPSLGPARVSAVRDGLTLVLEDGRIIRLAGIDTPLPTRSGSGIAQGPSRKLTELAAGRMVDPRGAGDLDRYGRLVAHVVRDDGAWLEDAMLSAGMARVRTTRDHRELAAPMLRQEEFARNARIGLWKTSLFGIKQPDALSHSSGFFEIAEGTVDHVEQKSRATSLHFSNSDATVEFAADVKKLFPASRRDPTIFNGQTLRVRGWIAWKGHPIIEVDHPEQIEFLGDRTDRH